MIDWLADYFDARAEHPVSAAVQPGEIRAQLPVKPPQTPESFEALLEDLENIVMPGLTHWQSPNFFAYFPANNSPPSVLAELVSAGLGVQGMLWQTSPACTEIEMHMLDWLADALVLPPQFHSSGRGGGVIQDSASSGLLCALIAARDLQVAAGHQISQLQAYGSLETHSSFEKGSRIAGLGVDGVIKLDVDDALAMRPAALEQAIESARIAGRRPFFVCATVGTTSSLAIDPVVAIGTICQREGLWLHVDAAMAGNAAICPEFRNLLDGVEFADSFTFNPHKWLLTNFDCSALYVANRQHLISALTVTPEYLRNDASATGQVTDYRDWQIPLGRRFRALKLWFVMRSYGILGLQNLIRYHVELARQFASWVEAHPHFELTVPRALNLVCFHDARGDEFTRRLFDEINRSGKIYISHTMIKSRFAIRFCIGQAYSEETHVRAAFELFAAHAQNLAESLVGPHENGSLL